MAHDDATPEDASDDPGAAPGEPASPGVVGEEPNRFDPAGTRPLDEAPEGRTPSDPTKSSDDSLPPG